MKTIQSKIILIFTAIATLILGLIIINVSSMLDDGVKGQSVKIHETISRNFDEILSNQLYLIDLKLEERQEQTENFIGYLSSSETLISYIEHEHYKGLESFLNIRDNHYLLDYLLIFNNQKELVATYPPSQNQSNLGKSIQELPFGRKLFNNDDPTLYYSTLVDLNNLPYSFLEQLNLKHFASSSTQNNSALSTTFGQLILNNFEEPIGYIVAGYFLKSMQIELDQLSKTADFPYFIHQNSGSPIVYNIPNFQPEFETSLEIGNFTFKERDEIKDFYHAIEGRDFKFKSKSLKNRDSETIATISTAYSIEDLTKEENSIINIALESNAKLHQKVILIGIISLIIFFLASFYIGRRIGHPILTLAENMKNLAAGKLDQMIKGTKNTDEIGAMAKAVEVFKKNAIEKQSLETHLKQSEERYALAAKGTNDGLWDWDISANSLYLSTRWFELIGYGENELKDVTFETWLSFVHQDDRAHFKKDLDDLQKRKTDFLNTTYRMQKKDGDSIWVLTRGVATYNKNKEAVRIAGSQTDITIQKKNEEKLYHDAFHDALTGLPNRSLFLDRLTQNLKQYRRNTSNKFAVLFLDLDNFKGINDTYGHDSGDDYIIEFSKRLLKSCRETDTVSRFGGDEFSILVNNVNSIDAVKSFCDNIQQNIFEPVTINKQLIYPTASIGVAFIHKDYKHAADMLRDADFALYQAKFNGKNRYEIFDEKMRQHAANRFRMEHDLKKAIERNEIYMLYQPIVDLQNKDLIGFEALMRWKHKEFGLISPMDFIPLAEESNMISKLTEFAIQTSCIQMKKWHKKFKPENPWFVSVNVSAKQLEGDNLVTTIQNDLKKINFSSQYLKVEITETFLMSDPSNAIRLLEGLQKLGIRVLIDDFGTGYSSLSHIHKFAFDGIKIDKSFVQDIDLKVKSQKMVELISHMAKFLSMRTVVEGIETEQEFSIVKNLKCDYGQGYLFSRPIAAEEVVEILENGTELLFNRAA